MIARLDKSYYFADSLGRKISTYPFVTKKFRRMVPRKLQKLIICVDFTQFIEHIFFKILQRNLNKLQVLNFISNFCKIASFNFEYKFLQ